MMMLFPIVLSLAIIQWILTKIIVRPGSEFGEDKLRYTAGSKAYFTLQILTAIVL